MTWHGEITVSPQRGNCGYSTFLVFIGFVFRLFGVMIFIFSFFFLNFKIKHLGLVNIYECKFSYDSLVNKKFMERSAFVKGLCVVSLPLFIETWVSLCRKYHI